MKIEYYINKNKINLEKHGVELSQAIDIEWDTLFSKIDDRNNYLEQRMIGYAYIGNRLYCVVYVDRLEVRRVISLRKANIREVENYANA